MGTNNYQRYREAGPPLPEHSLEWPLYGAGLKKLGVEGGPVERSLPAAGPDELLIRHDAVGLCFTDVKEILFGEQHPRLAGRNLADDPVVPGHEACMTVMRVGENLRDRYRVGERFAIQPDVWYRGKSIPYSFGMDGAYRQFGVIGKEVLQGDEGSYLIPIPPGMSYAGAALTEPWGCVEASYRTTYRSTFLEGGNLWVCGSPRTRKGYHLDKIWPPSRGPALVVLTDVPDDLERRVSELCRRDGVSLKKMSVSSVEGSNLKFHDILVLDGDPQAVNRASGLMGTGCVLALSAPAPMSGSITMDFGRVHYDGLLYVGTTSLALDGAYMQTPVRCTLKTGGTALMLGGAGPMGRMHVQRAVESAERPSRIVATDIEVNRLEDLRTTFLPYARSRGVQLSLANPVADRGGYDHLMAEITRQGGFDDVQVMVTSLEAIAEVSSWIAAGGVINLFAGLKRGTIAEVDPFLIYGPRQVRYVGHSGLKMADQVAIVERYNRGELEPHRSVAAICGMRQIPEGIRAMQNATFPGKIVVYPMVADFPLTGLQGLDRVLPEVHRALKDGGVWTNEAEELFLALTLG